VPKPDVILAPCVESELWAIWEFIASDNPDAATQVVESAYATFNTLATTPELGRLRKFRNPKLKGIRSWQIAGFENYLIFYRPEAGGIQVLHVFHGARNFEALFGGK
jgi:plasmid stabilization system protein ParE